MDCRRVRQRYCEPVFSAYAFLIDGSAVMQNFFGIVQGFYKSATWMGGWVAKYVVYLLYGCPI